MTQAIDQAFLFTIETLVTQHHTIYPWIPPQGIYFESLVYRAFHLSGSPGLRIVQPVPNAPQYDLMVGDERVSLKTETGKGTKATLINITKLCTTERDPWEPEALVVHVMDHLSRYDRILMLRAVWPPDQT